MKIYIAGPMRGYDQYNFPAFMKAEELLKKEGWNPINPAGLDLDDGFDTNADRATITKEELERFIMRDVGLVISADAICMLSGWEISKGAVVEHAVARYAGIPVYFMSRGGAITR